MISEEMKDPDYIRKTYNKYAKDYHRERQDPSSTFFNFIESQTMQKELEHIVRFKKVLDLGCGSGIFTKKLRSWGADVYGLDLSPGMLKIAKQDNPTIQFYEKDARDTGFPDEYFNLVSSSLLAHYCKDVNPLFQEVNRILKLKGNYVFTTGHPFFYLSGSD